jgi:NADPH-dependent stearoyl-CoA 9-desaturase
MTPTAQQLDALQIDLDALKQRIQDQLGEEDARYIKRVILVQRLSAIVGRLFMVLGFLSPWLWQKFSITWKLDIMYCMDNTIG